MNIENFQNLSQTKYIWMYYYLICPKIKEQLLNKYKTMNIPVPEYLDENKLINYTNSINKEELSKLIKNNNKNTNQKYLDFLNKIFNNIEHFNYNNYYNYILILILIVLFMVYTVNLFRYHI